MHRIDYSSNLVERDAKRSKISHCTDGVELIRFTMNDLNTIDKSTPPEPRFQRSKHQFSICPPMLTSRIPKDGLLVSGKVLDAQWSHIMKADQTSPLRLEGVPNIDIYGWKSALPEPFYNYDVTLRPARVPSHVSRSAQQKMQAMEYVTHHFTPMPRDDEMVRKFLRIALGLRPMTIKKIEDALDCLPISTANITMISNILNQEKTLGDPTSYALLQNGSCKRFWLSTEVSRLMRFFPEAQILSLDVNDIYALIAQVDKGCVALTTHGGVSFTCVPGLTTLTKKLRIDAWPLEEDMFEGKVPKESWPFPPMGLHNAIYKDAMSGKLLDNAEACLAGLLMDHIDASWNEGSDTVVDAEAALEATTKMFIAACDLQCIPKNVAENMCKRIAWDTISGLIESGALVATDLIKTGDSICGFLQSRRSAMADKIVVRSLVQIAKNRNDPGFVSIPQPPDDYMSICEEQRYAISMLQASPIVYVGGGGGSGKTELLSMVAKGAIGKNVLVLSYVATVASVLARRVHPHAMTCHQFLSKHWTKCPASPGFDGAGDTECPAASIRVLIIDEVSVMYPELLACVLHVVSECGQTHSVLLTGDRRQLPSMKAGDVVSDLLRGLPEVCIEFGHNHRVTEAEFSAIRANSERIATGKWNLTFDDKAFTLRPPVRGRPEVTLQSVLRELGMPSVETVHIIARTNELCRTLAPVVNDHFHNAKVKMNEIVLNAKLVFKKNDFIMGVRNNEILILDDVVEFGAGPKGEHAFQQARATKSLPSTSDTCSQRCVALTSCPSWRTHTAIVCHPMSNTTETRILFLSDDVQSSVRNASVTTNHSFQGSQVETVIYVDDGKRSRFDTRESLYTAVTRASKRVIVIADEDSLCHMITNPEKQRKSILYRALASRKKEIINTNILFPEPPKCLGTTDAAHARSMDNHQTKKVAVQKNTLASRLGVDIASLF